MKKKSSAEAREKVLGVISPSSAEGFITELVNLPTDFPGDDGSELYAKTVYDKYQRIAARYPDILRTKTPLSATRTLPQKLLQEWARQLKFAWARDKRELDWTVYKMRDSYSQADDPAHNIGAVLGAPAHVPRISAFEAAMVYFQTRLADRRLLCPNPTCEAPYFFKPKNKRTQKYCSPECSDHARRKSKLLWWANHPR